MSLINMWVGAPTSTSFRLVAKVSGSQARMVVSTNKDDLYNPVGWLSEFVAPSADGVVKFTPSGLEPGTQYYYAVEVDGVWQPTHGKAKTAPAPGEPASFTFAASSCSGHYNDTTAIDGGTTFWPPESGVTDVSNHAVFEHIRARNPDLFIHTGDLHYRDYNVNDPALWRQGYDDVLSAPNQAALYRDVPLVYTWDDHDYCGNDSNVDSIGRSAAAQVYRERVPHFPLTDGAEIGVWQTWAMGRVRFIMTDSRSYQDDMDAPDGEGHHALGVAQEAWLKQTMLDATEPLICWVNPMPWAANMNQHNWDKFSTERTRLVQFFKANNLDKRMFMISGDWHGMGFDDGRNNAFGGFPIYQLSSLDSAPSGAFAGAFSHGTNRQRGQYGVISVADNGDSITVLAEGYRNADLLLTHTFTIGTAAIEPGEPVDGVVPVNTVHRGADTAIAWRTLYNGDVVNVLAVRVGAVK